MSVCFNHTIVHARDRQKSAAFLTEMLGLRAPVELGPFLVVALDNGASLDFIETDEAFAPQHYAFLIGETDFDQIFARLRERGVDYWADPRKTRQGEINRHDGGRGVYFEDPDGHFLEVLTRPYGSGA
jgi:catechol 2,3-dioxygenase-like lactoylglutathione lyase family enzyme